MSKQFPSPPGTSYFLIPNESMINYISQVSVPSGDFLFFNAYPNFCDYPKLFPSPPGTSYFLIPSLPSLDSSGSGKRFAAQTAKALLFLFLET